MAPHSTIPANTTHKNAAPGTPDTEGPASGPLDLRLVELEVRYTHLEQQFSELSQVVFEQQTIIAELQRHLRAIRGRVDELGEPTPNDQPPHY